jgi:hypothetical protein
MKRHEKQYLVSAILSFSFVMVAVCVTCDNGAIIDEQMVSQGPSNRNQFEEILYKQGLVVSDAPADASELYALIIGISDYPGTDNDLNYCDDDADDYMTYLQDKYGIPSSHITKLKDYQATKANIASALSTISAQMDANDYFFFAYSGHGSADISTPVDNPWVVNSPHNYYANMDQYWTYSSPGADMMRVHFPRIDTEDGYDGVFIGDNRDRSVYWDLFTGSYTNVYSYWVYTDQIYVNLYTDYIYNYWGFSTDYVQTATWTSPYELIPYDGLTVGSTGAELDFWLDTIPGTIIVVLDSCFSGGVGADIAQAGRYIMTASTNRETSIEHATYQNGVFTSAFIDTMAGSHDDNGDGITSFEESFDNIYTLTVSRSTSIDATAVHHPVEFDGISGITTIAPWTNISSVSLDNTGSLNAVINIRGLGYGEAVAICYDTINEAYFYKPLSQQFVNSLSSQTLNANIGVPGHAIDAAILIFKAIYNNLSFIARESIVLSGSFSSSIDSDGDGYVDVDEFELGTNPWSSDTDGDGIDDKDEIEAGLDPLVDDAMFDYDLDTLPNYWEVSYGLDPWVSNLYSDTDGEGLSDVNEYFHVTDPTNVDTDADGLDDHEEVFDYFTSPVNADSDNDLYDWK